MGGWAEVRRASFAHPGFQVLSTAAFEFVSRSKAQPIVFVDCVRHCTICAWGCVDGPGTADLLGPRPVVSAEDAELVRCGSQDPEGCTELNVHPP